MANGLDTRRRTTRGPQDGAAAPELADDSYRTGARGAPVLTPNLPTKITDRPDGMVPTVTPKVPQPSLAARPSNPLAESTAPTVNYRGKTYTRQADGRYTALDPLGGTNTLPTYSAIGVDRGPHSKALTREDVDSWWDKFGPGGRFNNDVLYGDAPRRRSAPTAPTGPTGPGPGAGPRGNGLLRREAPAWEARDIPDVERREERGVGIGEDIPGVSGRLNQLLEDDSPYLQRARLRARQTANRRGLLNTSIAAGAGEAAAIDAALPIAQGDVAVAEAERGRVLQEFMQANEHRVQQIMQERGMSFEAAQNELQRQFAGRQAALDRAQQQYMQERSLSHDAAMQAASRDLKRNIAVQTGQQHADALYQTSLDRLTANTELPQEERERMSEHYAYVYDQSKQAIENIYNVELGTNPRQRPAEPPNTGAADGP